MRICHLTNVSATRCGIRNFGDQLSLALRHAGHEVLDWDIEYSYIYALIQQQQPAYLPADVLTYDVVHHNWHPITSNTFGPGHFPWPSGSGPLVSVYLHDIPPFSGCPFHDRAEVRFTAEPSPGCVEIPYPIADWLTDLPEPDPTVFSVGVAGVRGDGIGLVREVCASHNWPVIEPPRDGWLSFDDAVRHQARATVNVQWYFEGRGKSGGASQAIASCRPVLLNHSAMFSHLASYGDCLYIREDLETALEEIHRDWQESVLCHPHRVIRERGWLSWGVPAFIHAWKEALDAR